MDEIWHVYVHNLSGNYWYVVDGSHLPPEIRRYLSKLPYIIRKRRWVY